MVKLKFSITCVFSFIILLIFSIFSVILYLSSLLELYSISNIYKNNRLDSISLNIMNQINIQIKNVFKTYKIINNLVSKEDDYVIKDDGDIISIDNYFIFSRYILDGQDLLKLIRYCEHSGVCISMSPTQYTYFPLDGSVNLCAYKGDVLNSSLCVLRAPPGTYDLFKKEYYIISYETSKKYWYAYYSNRGEKLVSFSEPVFFKNGTTKGVINICFGNSETDEFIRNIAKSVTDVSGIILYDSIGNIISKSYNDSSYSVYDIINVFSENNNDTLATKIYKNINYDVIKKIKYDYVKYINIEDNFILAIMINSWTIDKYTVIISIIAVITFLFIVGCFISVMVFINIYLKRIVNGIVGRIKGIERFDFGMIYASKKFIKFWEFEKIISAFDELFTKLKSTRGFFPKEYLYNEDNDHVYSSEASDIRVENASDTESYKSSISNSNKSKSNVFEIGYSTKRKVCLIIMSCDDIKDGYNKCINLLENNNIYKRCGEIVKQSISHNKIYIGFGTILNKKDNINNLKRGVDFSLKLIEELKKIKISILWKEINISICGCEYEKHKTFSDLDELYLNAITKHSEDESIFMFYEDIGKLLEEYKFELSKFIKINGKKYTFLFRLINKIVFHENKEWNYQQDNKEMIEKNKKEIKILESFINMDKKGIYEYTGKNKLLNIYKDNSNDYLGVDFLNFNKKLSQDHGNTIIFKN